MVESFVRGQVAPDKVLLCLYIRDVRGFTKLWTSGSFLGLILHPVVYIKGLSVCVCVSGGWCYLYGLVWPYESAVNLSLPLSSTNHKRSSQYRFSIKEHVPFSIQSSNNRMFFVTVETHLFSAVILAPFLYLGSKFKVTTPASSKILNSGRI